MNNEQQNIYKNEYLPYIVRVGKITSWLSLPLIFIPALVVVIFFGARPDAGGVLTGLIGLCSAMLAWYIVDPVTLYPILHIPGMYMTYLCGNSKEIRAPAATAALSAAGVEAGTEHGTIVAGISIAISIFISVGTMTLVAILGNAILAVLPQTVLHALNYLLPSLFGTMCMQRILLDPKSSLIILPISIALKFLSMNGFFKFLPFGGGYAQILLCVIAGVIVARIVHKDKLKA
ncbi:MAG: hypothetical protein IIZ27_03775 [Solobacterium sp.]|nr:hypothetical protein [Solobacterium sp.]MBR2670193.1 hypothetical protein [Solobacterium sp.]